MSQMYIIMRFNKNYHLDRDHTFCGRVLSDLDLDFSFAIFIVLLHDLYGDCTILRCIAFTDVWHSWSVVLFAFSYVGAACYNSGC